jgi:hypothetical protein
MRVSVAIQHHPSRRAALARLRAQLPTAQVVTDPDPYGERNPWRTYQQCLRRVPTGASHHLILQDDVIVCPDFIAGLEAAIAAHPTRVLSLCITENEPYNAQRVHIARLHGYSWVELMWLDQGSSPQALVWPARIAIDFAWWRAPSHPHIDAMCIAQGGLPWSKDDSRVIAEYWKHRGITAIATVPSIVHHPDDHPSLTPIPPAIAHLHGARPTAYYTGKSALSVDWSTKPYLLPIEQGATGMMATPQNERPDVTPGARKGASPPRVRA